MRASVDVRSHVEGDALKLSLGHPAIKAVGVITGLLLELPSAALRARVLTLVQLSVQIADVPYDEPGEAGTNGNLGRLHDANTTGE